MKNFLPLRLRESLKATSLRGNRSIGNAPREYCRGPHPHTPGSLWHINLDSFRPVMLDFREIKITI